MMPTYTVTYDDEKGIPQSLQIDQILVEQNYDPCYTLAGTQYEHAAVYKHVAVYKRIHFSYACRRGSHIPQHFPGQEIGFMNDLYMIESVNTTALDIDTIVFEVACREVDFRIPSQLGNDFFLE